MSSILRSPLARKFILGGNALVTFKSKKTGRHFTYKVKKCKNMQLYFVSVLSNTFDKRYTYIGCINRKNAFIVTEKSKVAMGHEFFRVFRWAWHNLDHPDLEVFHNGICGRCGRTLTDPKSIKVGFGPECIKKI